MVSIVQRGGVPHQVNNEFADSDYPVKGQPFFEILQFDEVCKRRDFIQRSFNGFRYVEPFPT
jgi:hypothetical protein